MRFERWWYTVPLRLRSLFRRERVEEELDEELRFHIDRLTDEHVARGLTAEAARLAAVRAMRGVEQRKEECRDMRRVRFVEDAARDFAYAVRTLGRKPGFALAAIGTLVLGIGTTVAMFTVVNGVLVRPMPFPDPDRLFLVSLAARGPFMAQPGLSDRSYLAFREQDTLFQHLAAFSSRTANLTGSGDPAVLRVAGITTDFFATLGVQPSVGRTFLANEEHRIILGDALWRSRFGADPAILGREIALDGERAEVVGVMPAGFTFPRNAEAWTPQTIRFDPHLTLMVPVLGRLKPGVTRAQATAEFETFARSRPENADRDSTWIAGVRPLKDLLVGDIRRPLQIFAGAVGLVLLIACANVANLLLARASGRQREMAVRAALGAGRGRLIRQLLTESLLVSLAGGAGGLLLARWGVPALLALAPDGRIPRADMIRTDTTVLAFTLGISTLTGIVFGLAPALHLTRGRLRGSLLPGGRTLAGGQDRLRALLVIGEIALALVLLTGAGLLLKSFFQLRAVDSGFRPDNVLTMTVDLPGSAYPTAQKLQAFHTDTLTRLAALPGVRAAGAVNWRPLGTMVIRGDFQVEGGSVPDDFTPDKTTVSPGYFQAMGIRLLRGRDFADHDGATGPAVAIVSRTVARLLSSSEDPIGRRIAVHTPPRPEDWLTIVGVVDDVKQFGPANEAHAAIYQPYLQVTQKFFLSHMTFAVRTDTDPLRLAPMMREVLREVDPNQPPQSIAPMSSVVANATAEPRFQARLLSVFAALALLLALVGTYGVLAYSVAQRTHEIGVRVALGASRAAVMWLVVRRTLLLAGTGVAIGTAGALASTRVLMAYLFQTPPNDARTFAAVAVAVMAAALAAGFIPARRATRVDPLVALRHE
jgi:putative ABC transport system permease protein